MGGLGRVVQLDPGGRLHSLDSGNVLLAAVLVPCIWVRLSRFYERVRIVQKVYPVCSGWGGKSSLEDIGAYLWVLCRDPW